MAILQIKKFNEPILRKKSKTVKKVDKKIKKLIVDMVQTMANGRGIGLAAPQVGVLKRVIVAQTGLKGQGILGLVNPKILKKSREKEIAEEGCLSFPGIFLKIKRAKEVEVEGLNINSKKIELKAKGLFARVLEHEIEHLDGILFFQRLGLFQKLKFKLKHGFN